MQSHQLFGVESIKQFILSGNAIFTIKNIDTNNHLTFRVRHKPDKPHFVSVLTGPNNNDDYDYLGTIFQEMNYQHGRKSRIGYEAQSNKAFVWLWNRIRNGRELPAQVEVWHEGRCGRCGRKLTTPGSLEVGFGPECSAVMGL